MPNQPFHLLRTEKLITVAAFGSSFVALTPAGDVVKRDVDGVVRCVAFGESRLAVGGDARTVFIWDTQSWELVAKVNVFKRPTALSFVNKDSELLVADRFGDVYRIPIDVVEKQKLLLGHCSWATDMILMEDKGLIVTADRDGKIRVSCYPNTFEIHGFCLGHKSYVTKICRAPGISNQIASGGGDGILIFWDLDSCKEIRRLSFIEHLKRQDSIDTYLPPVISLASCLASSVVATLFEGVPFVFLVSLVGNQWTVSKTLELPGPALDLEFDESGNLLVALEKDTSKLVVVSEFKGEYGLFAEGKTTSADRLNETGTVETFVEIDYAGFTSVLRKLDEDELHEKRAGKRQKKA